METTRYRYCRMPDHLIDAVQLSAANEREVFEWAPGKQFIGPAPDYAPDGLTIFCGDSSRRHARYGSWVYREAGTNYFGVCGAEVFSDYFMPEFAGGNMTLAEIIGHFGPVVDADAEGAV